MPISTIRITGLAIGLQTVALGAPNAPRASVAPSIARYVPADVPLFVSVDRLDRTEEALVRARVGTILPLLAGAPGASAKPLDLRHVAMGLLGVRGGPIAAVLMRSRLGIAASSWTDFSAAVWLVDVEDVTILERWFPLNRRIGYTRIGKAEYFRTPTGFSACVRDGIVALTRRGPGHGSLFSGILTLMADRGGRPLASSASFHEQMAYLPPRYLAMAYVSPKARSAHQSHSRPTAWWTDIDHLILGVYEGQGRLDLAIRVSSTHPHRRPRLSSAGVDRLLALPRTTLLASIMTLDFRTVVQAAGGIHSQGTLGRYLRLLASMPNASESSEGADWSQLGPQLILAWDQDLRLGKSAPQLALLVESGDSRLVNRRVRSIAANLIQLVEAIEPASTDVQLTVETSRHLGSTISYIPLKRYAKESRLGFMKLLSGVEPAWTIRKGWLVVAMSRAHVQRIIEAQLGLIPALAAVPDVQLMRRGPANRSMLSIAQSDMAANVLNDWLKAYRNGAPSLLDPSWWQVRPWSGHGKLPRLGIGMAKQQVPGVVTVARVYTGTAADGRLLPEDQILGIDGKLLSLQAPNADLRRGWMQSSAHPGPTVRVHRDGTSMDIVLPKTPREDPTLLAGLRTNPADALRELSLLAKTLEFTSFAVLPTDDEHYSARLSLRFGPTAQSPTTNQR